jgi:hypothetical protein
MALDPGDPFRSGMSTAWSSFAAWCALQCDVAMSPVTPPEAVRHRSKRQHQTADNPAKPPRPPAVTGAARPR